MLTQTYLNSAGPFLADGQYNRHPGRGITTDQLSATINPESSRRYAPVEWSSRSDSSPVRRSQMEVPSHARCAVQEFRKMRGPVLSCKPTPYLECQTNTLTYHCVTASPSQRRRRLVLIFLLLLLLYLLQDLLPFPPLLLLFPFLFIIIIIIIIPFDAGAVEKCHEVLRGQTKFL